MSSCPGKGASPFYQSNEKIFARSTSYLSAPTPSFPTNELQQQQTFTLALAAGGQISVGKGVPQALILIKIHPN